jgi:hypothetical protein
MLGVGHRETLARFDPVDVKGHRGGLADRIQEAEERVWDIEVVEELQVVDAQRGRVPVVINMKRSRPDRDGPEQAIWIRKDSRIEIRDLGGEVLEVVPTSVEVKSNKDESSMMRIAVLPDIATLHVPHVGVVQKPFRLMTGQKARAAPLYVGCSDVAHKVPDHAQLRVGV